MPTGIFLFEVDKSFGPNVLAEYYLGKEKVTKEILKTFIEKFVKKNFQDAITQSGNVKFYSSKINGDSIGKENLFLGFILKEGEDVVSLKSVFDKSEKKVIEKYTSDKIQLRNVLKEILTSILTLMDKLKEPKIIIETINEKTKKMLDEGKLQKARELIDLGEEIPEKLSNDIKLAEEYYHQGLYKKAKKSYLKAAKLAHLIQEEEIVSFLENKAEHVGKIPELIRERENLTKDMFKILNSIDLKALGLYDSLIEFLDSIITISHALEDENLVEILAEMKRISSRISRSAKDLIYLNEKLKEITNKIR
ncbi:MAG: hypothetical protein ACTSU4_14530 [Promethearchaeota archaeon]